MQGAPPKDPRPAARARSPDSRWGRRGPEAPEGAWSWRPAAIVSDLDVVDPDGTGRVDTILVCVAPPDGAAITATLRDRGFSVVESPLSMLGARAVGETPQVIVVDVDMPGVVEVVDRAREASPRTEILCVGDLARAAEIGLSQSDGRAFDKPVDVESLLLAVVALAEPAVDLRQLGSAPSLQPFHGRSPLSGAPETTPPARRDSEAPPASGLPSTSDPLEIAAILPAFDDPESFGAIAPIDVSPELAQLLESAEQRVSELGLGSPSSVPSPDEEADLILSADMLSVLDEPLSPDDDSATGGSGATGGVTGVPRAGTTGSKPASAAPPPTTAGTALERYGIPGTETAAGRGSSASALPPPVATATPPSAPPPARPASAPPAARVAPEPSVERVVLSPAVVPAAPVVPPVIPQATAEPPAAEEPSLPAVLTPGGAIRALALSIAGRASGALALGQEGAMRRIVLHDGDVVTAASSAPDETLIAFLAARGDLERDVAVRLSARLPPFGRHAGAALIAHGHLGQDDLWPVLRAHAEWIIGRALVTDEGTCELEIEPAGRLRAEPNVFGGATGAEVMLEAIRRVLPPKEAERRLGGLGARLSAGPRHALLAECALSREEEQLVRSAPGRTLGDVLSGAAPELADVLYGLAALGVLEALAPSRRAEPASAEVDPLDEEAIRQRVRARIALVEDGDYFALLGIAHGATGYEIRRAYLELRRAFEPSRVLTGATADLAGDVQLVIEVLDEAYEILREPHRRERYRRAIEAGPP
jgi:hypothetical protein